jgi:uncharacterized OB-fold protein
MSGHNYDEFFWAGVEQERLMVARCARCSSLQHPPSPMCPVCGSVQWTAQQVSGRGTVHSWIVSHHPTEADDLARIVVLVELEEGVRLVANLRNVKVEDVQNDMPVELTFTEIDGVKLPQFQPAAAP